MSACIFRGVGRRHKPIAQKPVTNELEWWLARNERRGVGRDYRAIIWRWTGNALYLQQRHVYGEGPNGELVQGLLKYVDHLLFLADIDWIGFTLSYVSINCLGTVNSKPSMESFLKLRYTQYWESSFCTWSRVWDIHQTKCAGELLPGREEGRRKPCRPLARYIPGSTSSNVCQWKILSRYDQLHLIQRLALPGTRRSLRFGARDITTSNFQGVSFQIGEYTGMREWNSSDFTLAIGVKTST